MYQFECRFLSEPCNTTTRIPYRHRNKNPTPVEIKSSGVRHRCYVTAVKTIVPQVIFVQVFLHGQRQIVPASPYNKKCRLVTAAKAVVVACGRRPFKLVFLRYLNKRSGSQNHIICLRWGVSVIGLANGKTVTIDYCGYGCGCDCFDRKYE